jgi:hypothetical protein
MGDRSISWVGTISDKPEEKGPVSFTPHRLEKQEHLFAHRSALFYTPTENIPIDYIGSGPLDIMLPVARLPTGPILFKSQLIGVLVSGSTLSSGKQASCVGAPDLTRSGHLYAVRLLSYSDRSPLRRHERT